MTSRVPIGSLVKIQGCDLGIGKLVALDGRTAAVEWFRSISERDVRDYDISNVTRVAPAAQTRCYVSKDGDSWRMGRIMNYSSCPGGTGIEYDIHFPQKAAAYMPEECVYVRCSLPSVDPMETLVLKAHETPFFHNCRSKFYESIVRQRATAHGLTGLLSAPIRLYPHQIMVIRRVLEDPVQRYLLADEVGLGKTIEAGVVLRQLWLDDPETRALIIVPAELLAQWESELNDRLDLDVDDEFLRLITYDEVPLVSDTEQYDIAVVDEAQNVARSCYSDDGALWEACRRIAHATPRLLLLSATPAIHNEREFLAMLHMLEPQHYRLDDIDRFRRCIEARGPIGRLLLLLTEATPTYPLRQCMNAMRQLFEDDDYVMQRVIKMDQLLGRNADRRAVNSIIRELRIHICETHRIYRRMVRTSRSSLASGTLQSRTKGDVSANVVAEYEYDDRLSDVLPLIEEWRLSAMSMINRAEDDDRERLQERVVDIYIILVEGAGTWLGYFRQLLSCRLGSHYNSDTLKWQISGDDLLKLTSIPLFEGEEAILSSMLSKMDATPDDGDQIDMLSDYIAAYQRKDTKSVVFTSYSSVASEIILRLRAIISKTTVVGHLACDDRQTRDDALDVFRTDPRTRVLVCDRSGEEGLNLQCADEMIHFDIPWDPNRIEQRIGRLDRIGRTGAMSCRAYVASCDTSRSVHEAWYEMLKDGLRIFDESVADLQFFFDREIPALRNLAFVNGTQGLDSRLESMRDAISQERKAICENTALDAIEAVEREDVDFLNELIKTDEDAQAIRFATELWAKTALKLKRMPDSHAIGATGVHTPRHEVPVRYEGTTLTLIPKDWLLKLKMGQPSMGTYSREVACSGTNTAMLRIGHPFIDELTRYMLWDDRGKAFAMWRCVSGLAAEREGIYFQLDYVIEADLSPVLSVLAGFGAIDDVLRQTVTRRADAFFPPCRRVIFLDSELRPVSDPTVLALLGRAYSRDRLPHDPNILDYNLHDARQWVLEDFIAADRWEETCRKVRKSSESAIYSDDSFSVACESLCESAEDYLKQRLEQLRTGLRFYIGNDAIDADLYIQGELNRERTIYSDLIEGMRHPRVTLDAAGIKVLSSRDPFAIEEPLERTL